MNVLYRTLGACMLAAFSVSASSLPLLVEGFESADMSITTNSDGFRWAGGNKTYVVTSDRLVWDYGKVDVSKPAGKDWTPKTGSHALLIRYPAGEAWAEQRFSLGKPHKDLWLKYWVRVPTNFIHPTSGPSNQKFLSLWMDGYSHQGDGPTVWLSFWSDGNGGSTLSFAMGSGQHTIGQANQQYTQFITIPKDRGRWMQVVFHVKAASARGMKNGVIETWRRWEGQSDYTKLHDAHDLDIAPSPSGPQGWLDGYLMGWANAAYASETEWLIDDFIISDKSLIDLNEPATKPPPKPPTLQINRR